MDSAKPYYKLCVFCVLTLIALTLGMSVIASTGSDSPAYAAIVMDARTGEVLHARNANALRYPASLTKMMTLMLVFDALDAGRIRLDTPLKVSERATMAKPSKLGLSAGSTITVRDAIYALVTKSANDVAVVVAENLSGSEPAFAQRMTKRARELGMKRTYFKNASGLHDPGQVTTARDMARLGRALMTVHPKQYRYFSTRSFTYKGHTYANHNHLMKSYPGMDGLKTGYVAPSGFNLAASAMRGDVRLIGVVLGGQSTQARNARMKDLLDAGFARKDVGESTVRIANRDEKSLELRSPPDPPPAKPRGQTLIAALEGIQDSQTEEGDAPADGASVDRVSAGLTAVRVHRSLVTPASSVSYSADVRRGFSPYKSATVQPLLPPKGTVPVTLAPDRAGNWAVQVGTFASLARADAATMAALTALPSGMALPSDRMITPLETPGGGVLHRARIAGFASRNEAERACARLPRGCVVVGL